MVHSGHRPTSVARCDSWRNYRYQTISTTMGSFRPVTICSARRHSRPRCSWWALGVRYQVGIGHGEENWYVVSEGASSNCTERALRRSSLMAPPSRTSHGQATSTGTSSAARDRLRLANSRHDLPPWIRWLGQFGFLSPVRDRVNPQILHRPMWDVYRIDLLPHYGQGCGLLDEFGNEMTFPAAFRKTRDHRPKGIVRLRL